MHGISPIGASCIKENNHWWLIDWNCTSKKFSSLFASVQSHFAEFLLGEANFVQEVALCGHRNRCHRSFSKLLLVSTWKSFMYIYCTSSSHHQAIRFEAGFTKSS